MLTPLATVKLMRIWNQTYRYIINQETPMTKDKPAKKEFKVVEVKRLSDNSDIYTEYLVYRRILRFFWMKVRTKYDLDSAKKFVDYAISQSEELKTPRKVVYER